jgi:hypothetical protein
VEGQENFSVQAPLTVLHTRTIVDPRFGAKITGKVGRALVGLLVADDQAPGHALDATDPRFGQSATVFVGRARYVLYGDSTVGAIVTNREFADTYSRLAGVDGQFRLGQAYQIQVSALSARHRDLDGVALNGSTYEVQFARRARGLDYSLGHAVVDPGFRTDLGFVRRTDTHSTEASVGYTFWPETWVTSWGPRLRAQRIYDAAGTLQNNDFSLGGNVQFSNNISVNVSMNRDMERYADIDFDTTRLSVGGSINTSRVISFRGQFSTGRSIRFVDNPFLGDSTATNVTVDLRPVSRVRSEITLTTSRLVDPRSGTEEFDVRILRALSTYQFTDRFLVRNITEYDTSDKTVGLNLLGTYRVNSGTAFFIGYDDHYQQLPPIGFDQSVLPLSWRKTNRAIFTKLQFLLRY